jgi:hypothetical protein
MITMTKTRIGFLVFLVGLFPGALSWADEPPPAPQRVTISSAHRRYFVVSDPKSNQTQVFQGRPSGTPLWTIAGWHGVLFLSEDGTLAIGQPGNNLLERDAQPSDALLRLYRAGKLVRTITVGEVIPDSQLLRETTSHWYWGVFEGFSQGKFWLRRQDGKRFSFE